MKKKIVFFMNIFLDLVVVSIFLSGTFTMMSDFNNYGVWYIYMLYISTISLFLTVIFIKIMQCVDSYKNYMEGEK